MLTERFQVPCHKCQEMVNIYADPGEKVEAKTPPRCPDCKTPLGVETVAAKSK